jgi:hypothetical protein
VECDRPVEFHCDGFRRLDHQTSHTPVHTLNVVEGVSLGQVSGLQGPLR